MGEAETAAGPPAPPPLTDAETARIRRRVQLMVQITSRVGRFREGLALAARRLTPSEAAILADLEAHGMDVQQLRDVLCGAHVLVDAPDLYERWRFPKSRNRLSSHHKNIDKKLYPDIGLKGPLVREKLHGRTAGGTWVQLEKTPAAIGDGFKLPSMNDVRHLMDYVVYRITKANVGPWGRSGMTERRPMYLSPDLGVTVPLPADAEAELVGALEAIEDADDVTSASADLAGRFPPPERANTLAEIAFAPSGRRGRGLFGSSNVYVTEVPSAAAREMLGARHAPGRWELPEAARTTPVTLRAGDRELPTVARHDDLERKAPA